MEKIDTEQRAGLVRTLQIIVGALAAGVFFFLLIVVVILRSPLRPFDPQAIVSLTMAAFALTCIPGRLFVPGLIVNAGCQKIALGIWKPLSRQPNQPLPDTDEGKLMQLLTTKTIIGAAIVEGGAFGNLVAYMLEGQSYSIVLAVLGIVAILAAFPTRHGIDDWLQRQLRRVKEMRDLRS